MRTIANINALRPDDNPDPYRTLISCAVQVSRRHGIRSLTCRHLSARQKLACAVLLCWREAFVYFAFQVQRLTLFRDNPTAVHTLCACDNLAHMHHTHQPL